MMAATLIDRGAETADVRESDEYPLVRIPRSRNVGLGRPKEGQFPPGTGQAGVYRGAGGNGTWVDAARLPGKADSADAFALRDAFPAGGRAGLPVDVKSSCLSDRALHCDLLVWIFSR